MPAKLATNWCSNWVVRWTLAHDTGSQAPCPNGLQTHDCPGYVSCLLRTSYKLAPGPQIQKNGGRFRPPDPEIESCLPSLAPHAPNRI